MPFFRGPATLGDLDVTQGCGSSAISESLYPDGTLVFSIHGIDWSASFFYNANGNLEATVNDSPGGHQCSLSPGFVYPAGTPKTWDPCADAGVPFDAGPFPGAEASTDGR
jgi:hypothetical protein